MPNNRREGERPGSIARRGSNRPSTSRGSGRSASRSGDARSGGTRGSSSGSSKSTGWESAERNPWPTASTNRSSRSSSRTYGNDRSAGGASPKSGRARTTTSRNPSAKAGKSAAKPTGKSVANRKPSSARTSLARRRLTIALIVVVALALLGLGGWWLVKTANSSLQERQAQLEAVQEAEVAKPIAECKMSDLDFTVDSYQQSVQVGSGWNATVTITNKGADPCLADGAGKTIGVEVTSGTYQLVDTPTCAAPDSELPLLLGSGKSWQTTISWDGNDYHECTPGSAAAAGTYVMNLKYDGQVMEDAVVQLVN